MTTATQTDKRIRRYTPLKRTLDILLSGIGILVLSPILLILCIAIKLDSPGPILFRQKRVGIHKTHFQIYKFRTMRTDTPKDMPTHMLNNPEQYITHTGRFLRKTSLDELPQIFNIFKGDMSIVGPRPALPREVEQYGDYEKQRLYVTPGLSCYWQIAPHRNDLTFEEWMDLDVKYVKERSFWVDWKIIFKTFKVCLLGRGE